MACHSRDTEVRHQDAIGEQCFGRKRKRVKTRIKPRELEGEGEFSIILNFLGVLGGYGRKLGNGKDTIIKNPQGEEKRPIQKGISKYPSVDVTPSGKRHAKK